MERVWNASSFCCNDEQKTGLDRHNLISMTIPRYRVIIFSASVRYRLRLERGFSDWTIGWRFQGPVGGAEGARKEGVLNKRPTRLHNWARDWTLAAGGADGGRRWHRHHTFSGRWCKWDANEMQMNRPAQRCWVCGRRRPFATGVAFVFCFCFCFFRFALEMVVGCPAGALLVVSMETDHSFSAFPWRPFGKGTSFIPNRVICILFFKRTQLGTGQNKKGQQLVAGFYRVWLTGFFSSIRRRPRRQPQSRNRLWGTLTSNNPRPPSKPSTENPF